MGPHLVVSVLGSCYSRWKPICISVFWLCKSQQGTLIPLFRFWVAVTQDKVPPPHQQMVWIVQFVLLLQWHRVGPQLVVSVLGSCYSRWEPSCVSVCCLCNYRHGTPIPWMKKYPFPSCGIAQDTAYHFSTVSYQIPWAPPLNESVPFLVITSLHTDSGHGSHRCMYANKNTYEGGRGGVHCMLFELCPLIWFASILVSTIWQFADPI